MTDSSSPSTAAATAVCSSKGVDTKVLDNREREDGLHIVDCSLSRNFDVEQAETVNEGLVQDHIASSVGKYEWFDRARTLGSETYVGSSRESVDNSWNQESSSLCNGFELTAQLKPEDWVKAPEFIPGQKWQSRGFTETNGVLSTALQCDGGGGVLSTGNEDAFDEMTNVYPEIPESNTFMSQDLNPVLDGRVSEELCDLCQDVVLSALSEEDRQKHITECIENHEKEMERSFAIQRSQEKTCGICMDIVWEKAIISEQRFGILSNCSHVFCLACIRKWRLAKQFESKIVRACPECRVRSDFVTPSRYWVEDKEDKKKLIEEYKLALSKKPCKYFDKGRGECPFNEKCFYLHAHPDGRVASPKPVHRRRRPPTASSSQTESNTSHLVLYEFLDDWPLSRWEDLIFRLNFFELSLLSTSDEEDEDGEDDFDDSDLSGAI